MQRTYIMALYELMQKDFNVLSLLSDSGTDYDKMLKREFPLQCFNFGIAEQNKIGIASGMAALGKIPFVYTTGAFIAYRGYEFLRNDICFQNRNVKLVGVGSGISGMSTLGGSHHTTEDIAALRAIPNLTILSPATPIGLEKCINFAYEMQGPVYIRMGMSETDEIYTDTFDLSSGKLSKVLDGNDYAIFTTGTIITEVLSAVNLLAIDKTFAVYDVHTLKPIDKAGIISAVKNVNKVFTVEEHNINGGLGGSIAEVLSEEGIGIPLVRIGLQDCFAKGYGTSSEILNINGLDSDGIHNKIIEHI